MPTKVYKEVAGLIVGAVLILGGGLLVGFPRSGLFLHPADVQGGYFLDWVSRPASRVYGLVAMLLGVGLVWLARWPRWGARNAAIEDYVWILSQELSRHFGKKKYYGIEEVSRVAAESGCEKAYMAYAHAMFCSRSDFDAYYEPLHVACTYDGLRDFVSARYFGGDRRFDAAAVVRLATAPKEEELQW